MAITDNLRMTLKVCQLYYEENLSQKEIASQTGISRPQIQPHADKRQKQQSGHD